MYQPQIKVQLMASIKSQKMNVQLWKFQEMEGNLVLFASWLSYKIIIYMMKEWFGNG